MKPCLQDSHFSTPSYHKQGIEEDQASILKIPLKCFYISQQENLLLTLHSSSLKPPNNGLKHCTFL
jgi:hypothetical protein